MFDEVLQMGRRDFQDCSLARMYINAPALHNAIIVPPRPLGDMNPDIIMDAVENVLNSDEGIPVSDDFTVQLVIANLERGGARKLMQNLEKDRISKTSIITIRNNDNMCLARALTVAIARLQMDEATTPEAKRTAKNRYEVIRRGDNNRKTSQQKKKALEYHQLAGVSRDEPCTLADIAKFEDALGVDVFVFAAHVKNSVIYPNKDRPRRNRRVYLYNKKTGDDVGHFDAVGNVTGLLSSSYFCHQCLTPYWMKQQH